MQRMLITLTSLLVGSTLASGVAMADGHITTDEQKLSYAAGFQFANRVKSGAEQEGITLDSEAFAAAVKDVLNGADPAISQEEMQRVFMAQQKAVQEKRQAAAGGNREAGEKFRADYAGGEGVTKTASGLLYKVITAGEGKLPGPDATVEVHYEGKTIAGEVFDSSIQRGVPATFGLKGIIKGWQEALQLMKEGSKWEVVIPPEIAYGAQGAGPKIGPDSTLIFEIELLSIK